MKHIYLLILSLFCLGCSRSYDNSMADGSTYMDNPQPSKEERMENSLKTANKIMALKEKESILAYFERQNMKADEFNGVYIVTNNKTEGLNVINDDCTVEIEYSLLIMGSDNERFAEKKKATVNTKGDTKIAFGLIEALKVLPKGSNATVGVPSALNYIIDDNGEKIVLGYAAIYKVRIVGVLADGK